MGKEIYKTFSRYGSDKMFVRDSSVNDLYIDVYTFSPEFQCPQSVFTVHCNEPCV